MHLKTHNPFLHNNATNTNMCSIAQDYLVSFFRYEKILVCPQFWIFTTQNVTSIEILSVLPCSVSYRSKFALWLCIDGQS